MKQSRTDLIGWRIAKVLELSTKGLTQADIARELQVSEPTVSRDIAHLRQQSKDNISKYIEETLVYEFDKIHAGLELINKNCWQRYDTASTEKERYMFLSLAKETYQVKAALLDSSTIIDKAMKFVSRVNKSCRVSLSDKETRGLTSENSNPLIDENTEQAQSSITNDAKQDSTKNDNITES